MQYTALYDLKNPPTALNPVSDLAKKVTVAVATSAQGILAEPQSTPNHNARNRWAINALINAELVASQMMWAVLGNGDVQTQGNAVLDATVQYVVDVSVNTFAL